MIKTPSKERQSLSGLVSEVSVQRQPTPLLCAQEMRQNRVTEVHGGGKQIQRATRKQRACAHQKKHISTPKTLPTGPPPPGSSEEAEILALGTDSDHAVANWP